jgi:hypothetical protein
MHMAKSLKNNNKKKSYCIWIQQKKFQKYVFGMHFGFINQFIKVARTRLIFQKFQKNYFFFLLISRIMILYVRRIPDIKFFLLTSELPDKIRISLPRRTFLKS